jgi:hypothetical protein
MYVTDDGAALEHYVFFFTTSTNYYSLLKEKKGISWPLKRKAVRGNSG